MVIANVQPGQKRFILFHFFASVHEASLSRRTRPVVHLRQLPYVVWEKHPCGGRDGSGNSFQAIGEQGSLSPALLVGSLGMGSTAPLPLPFTFYLLPYIGLVHNKVGI